MRTDGNRPDRHEADRHAFDRLQEAGRHLWRAAHAELTEQAGYEKHDAAGNNRGSSRNGSSKKKLKGDFGEIDPEIRGIETEVFEPQIITMNQTRFTGFEGDLKEMYGVGVSRTLISTVTQAVMEEVKAWQNRPLEQTYAILCLDALRVKIRDGGAVPDFAALHRRISTLAELLSSHSRSCLARGAFGSHSASSRPDYTGETAAFNRDADLGGSLQAHLAQIGSVHGASCSYVLRRVSKVVSCSPSSLCDPA